MIAIELPGGYFCMYLKGYPPPKNTENDSLMLHSVIIVFKEI
jgi:hypothetical protein